MDQILSYFPGQKATIFLETKTTDGYRANSTTPPFVSRIFGFTSVDGYALYDGYLRLDGYNQPFTNIAVGMYFAQVTLPKMAAAVGSYFIDASYTRPVDGYPATQTYQIIVNAPFGNFGATTG